MCHIWERTLYHINKLLKFGISIEEVSKMMTKNGFIDILLYIPIDEIICKEFLTSEVWLMSDRFKQPITLFGIILQKLGCMIMIR